MNVIDLWAQQDGGVKLVQGRRGRMSRKASVTCTPDGETNSQLHSIGSTRFDSCNYAHSFANYPELLHDLVMQAVQFTLH
jgi:hypothetical protein